MNYGIEELFDDTDHTWTHPWGGPIEDEVTANKRNFTLSAVWAGFGITSFGASVGGLISTVAHIHTAGGMNTSAAVAGGAIIGAVASAFAYFTHAQGAARMEIRNREAIERFNRSDEIRQTMMSWPEKNPDIDGVGVFRLLDEKNGIYLVKLPDEERWRVVDADYYRAFRRRMDETGFPLATVIVMDSGAIAVRRTQFGKLHADGETPAVVMADAGGHVRKKYFREGVDVSDFVEKLIEAGYGVSPEMAGASLRG
jgi:hypothetical protein